MFKNTFAIALAVAVLAWHPEVAASAAQTAPAAQTSQAAQAAQASSSPIAVTSTAWVKSATGDALEPALSVPPGGKVLLKNTITNRGAVAAGDLTITNQVPAHMIFESLVSAAAGAKVTYSIDGVNFAADGALTVRVVRGGVELVRPAQPSEYRFVRWSLPKPLAAGGSAEVSFNAIVE